MEQQQVFEQVRQALMDHLKIEDSLKITLESRMGHELWWDSLNHIMIMQLLQDKFGIKITPESISRLTNIQRILNEIVNNDSNPLT